ncbi:hypothetical protein ACFL17_09795, partial [Pseudomonadota bacterium]
MANPSKHRKSKFVDIALPTPLRRTFEYRLAANVEAPRGFRVLVPFGRRKMIGVVMGQVDEPTIESSRLKTVLQVLDTTAVIEKPLLDLLCWASSYYHHPIGEVIFAALPAVLRKGKLLLPAQPQQLSLTKLGQDPAHAPDKRATVQKAILDFLRKTPKEQATVSELRAISNNWKSAATKLVDKGWAKFTEQVPSTNSGQQVSLPGPTPTPEQLQAIGAVSANLNRFHCFLLHGV